MAGQDYLVIGLGLFGQAVAQRLMERGNSVLGVDRNLAIVQDAAEWITEAVQLDATKQEALEEIEAGQFDTVIVAIGETFEGSVLATVLLKQVGVKRVIARAVSVTHEEVLRRVGADEIVFPERDEGQELANRLTGG